MRLFTGLVLATLLLTGETAFAQATPLTGTWSLNIPQISGVPFKPVWTVVDTGPTFEGDFGVTVQTVVRVEGEMTGRQLFGPIYIADSTVTARVLVPGVPVQIPPLPTTKALLFLNGNTLSGWALQSFNGAPVNVYIVQGARISQ